MTHIQAQTSNMQKVRLSQLLHRELYNHFFLGIYLPLIHDFNYRYEFQREMHKITGFVVQNYKILKPCIFYGYRS